VTRAERCASSIGPREIAEVARLVDDDSAKMLWYLWHNRHARLDELMELVGEACQRDVLLRITDRINPAARRLLGRPIVVFERSALDYHTGQHVFFHWWLNDEATLKPGRNQPPEAWDQELSP